VTRFDLLFIESYLNWEGCMNAYGMRRQFLRGLLRGLRVVWPILSALLTLIISLGLIVGFCEGWSILDSIYFAFITGLTIGYGDFAPNSGFTRTLVVFLGIFGALLIALLAAIAVKALHEATGDSES
jgi:hypothetical protein